MPGYTLEYKYYMATVSLRDEHDIHFCFGTAFFPRRILTAASCIYSKAHQEGFGGMYVMAGTSYNPQAGIPYFVQKINYSSHYENDNLNIRAIHDVGIITVSIIKYFKNCSLYSQILNLLPFLYFYVKKK